MMMMMVKKKNKKKSSTLQKTKKYFHKNKHNTTGAANTHIHDTRNKNTFFFSCRYIHIYNCVLDLQHPSLCRSLLRTIFFFFFNTLIRNYRQNYQISFKSIETFHHSSKLHTCTNGDRRLCYNLFFFLKIMKLKINNVIVNKIQTLRTPTCR